MSNHLKEKAILMAVEEAIKHQIDLAVDAILEDAKKNLEQEVRKSVDSVALNMLSHYSVIENKNELIIKVSKDV